MSLNRTMFPKDAKRLITAMTVSYTHLRAHETVLDIVCRLLLEKKKQYQPNTVHLYERLIENQLICTHTAI